MTHLRNHPRSSLLQFRQVDSDLKGWSWLILSCFQVCQYHPARTCPTCTDCWFELQSSWCWGSHDCCQGRLKQVGDQFCLQFVEIQACMLPLCHRGVDQFGAILVMMIRLVLTWVFCGVFITCVLPLCHGGGGGGGISLAPCWRWRWNSGSGMSLLWGITCTLPLCHRGMDRFSTILEITMKLKSEISGDTAARIISDFLTEQQVSNVCCY